MDNSKTSYFYCYSPILKARLIDAGERYICVGLHEKTGRKFWLFIQTDKLGDILAEWSARKQKN